MGTEQDIQDHISLYFTGTFLVECRNGIMYFEGGFRVLLDGFRHVWRMDEFFNHIFLSREDDDDDDNDDDDDDDDDEVMMMMMIMMMMMMG